jgi:hypothetical protein
MPYRNRATPGEKVAIQHVSLHLTAEAAQLLDQLAPSRNKRGQYVSDLICLAAQQTGLLQANPHLLKRIATVEARLAELRDLDQEVAALRAELQANSRSPTALRDT